MTRFIATHQSAVAGLLNLLVEGYLRGNFKPITPITSFGAENVAEAFKELQTHSHIGKVVINFPQENTLPLAPSIPAPKFCGDGTYVLVGGLGGLGKSVASWMASYGATNLMFLSRSAGKTDEDQAFAKELKLMGCSTQFCPVDIADASAAKEAVSRASSPIKGALHMAMVLADRGIFDMDLEHWNKAVLPKVQGAWNLHNLLPKDMDFMTFFSSNSGTHGFYGQSNYASGNTFLDAFSQYRQSLGLAASVMSIGPVDDVGFVSQHASTKSTLIQKIANLIWETSFLDTLHLAIARSSTKYAPKAVTPENPFTGFQAANHVFHAPEGSAPSMEPEDGAMWIWKRDARLAVHKNIQKASTAASTGSGNLLKQFMSSVAKDPSKLEQKSSVDLIAQELGRCVSNFLIKGDDEIDSSLGLSDAGVDSLVAIEIRNWWKQNLGSDVSVLELLGGGSIEQLGVMAAARLKAKYDK